MTAYRYSGAGLTRPGRADSRQRPSKQALDAEDLHHVVERVEEPLVHRADEAGPQEDAVAQLAVASCVL